MSLVSRNPFAALDGELVAGCSCPPQRDAAEPQMTGTILPLPSARPRLPNPPHQTTPTPIPNVPFPAPVAVQVSEEEAAIPHGAVLGMS